MSNMRAELIVGSAFDQIGRLPSGVVDLFFGSPPYANKTMRYGDDSALAMDAREWSRWMMILTEKACAKTDGWVIWVANGYYKDKAYHPACELLVAEAYGKLRIERPVIWQSNKLPGACRWFKNGYEDVMAFQRLDAPARAINWEEIADEPKYKKGGKFSNRNDKGKRIENGKDYPEVKLARPWDVRYHTISGGPAIAKRNEAPFPLSLAEEIVLACSRPGSLVCDPFSGSATTGHACMLHRRHYLGIDLRESQADLGYERLTGVQEKAIRNWSIAKRHGISESAIQSISEAVSRTA